ncbi:type II secretion system protein [Oculatella sp. FACHB-28]|uniref:prepilin-type N-terminal cleavage/methylation domain-containing protein n=1 Tax=Oculatella sp. FACHB-28 TaxID=2692845 RepID=UPI0016888A2D|nr:type II secretion system protein [Oculatella sp. FACHB-28]
MPQSIPLLNKPLKSLGRALSLAANRDASQLQGRSLQQVKSEQGVTLLECLVAISVIAILGAMIGPPLVFTAASRLQNQRAEQAFQIAQAEVDRLRVLVARGEHIPANLPPVVASLNGVPAPTGVSNIMKSITNCPNAYTGQQIPVNRMLRVDTTGDCKADFLVQLYRTNNNPAIADQRNRPVDFSVGVRVYSAKAESNITRLSNRPANLRFAAGQGDIVRDGPAPDRGRTGPLAVFNSDLIWTDRSGALCDYRQNPRC